MNLAGFITANMAAILAEWEVFARTLLPSAATMDTLALRDHAKQILQAIARDIVEPQSEQERADKSKGGEDDGVSDTAAAIHGALRHTAGFDLSQLFAEYRALRASVLRLWAAHADDSGHGALDQMTRFNEAIDQALAQSVGRYAEDLGKSRDTFIAILGHDLRSPLQALTVSAHVLASGNATEPVRTSAISRIQSSALSMAQMIRDLLEYTRTRLGKSIPIKAAPANLESLLRACMAEVEAGYPQRSFRIETGKNLTACVDQPRMQQAITNLLTNAVQHGTPGAAIELIARRDGDGTAIEVRNKGATIPAHALQVIFDPMVQLDGGEAGSIALGSTNLGLGLFIAREIVTGHGGSIAAESAHDLTSFTVRLPGAAARAPACN